MRTLSALLLPMVVAATTLPCVPEGPIVPKPSISTLSSAPLLEEAVANFSAALDAALSGTINAGWATENASFSIALVSKDQPDPGVPLWEYHHLAEANTQGTKELTRDSEYLIGSISKLLSSYVMLMAGVDVNVPVTEYIPELAEPGSLIHWENVTLRMLASHLSGAPPNYGFSEYYFLKEVFLNYGFPAISDSEYPSCGVIGLNKGCNHEELIKGMRTSYPVTATNQRPSYSNIAFTIIFIALENVTGKNYTILLDELLSQPLSLKATRPSSRSDGDAVIPPGENGWGSDYGDNVPAGGLVSTLSDLTKVVHALLGRTLPMSPNDVRGWLNAGAFVEGRSLTVGTPWETYRSSALTPAHPHFVTLHGKGGSAVGYRTQLYVADEYGVGFILLTAGPMDTINILLDSVLATLVPAVDQAARDEAKSKYAREFAGSSPGGRDGGNSMSNNNNKNNTATISSSASFALDDTSLVLTGLRRGDFDILSAVIDLLNLSIGRYISPVSQPLRLFHNDLDENIILDDGMPVTREVWRLWPTLTFDTSGSEMPGVGITAMDGACFTWAVGDWVYYGGEPIDRVLFYRDADGHVVGFEAPFLRTGVLRTV